MMGASFSFGLRGTLAFRGAGTSVRRTLSSAKRRERRRSAVRGIMNWAIEGHEICEGSSTLPFAYGTRNERTHQCIGLYPP